MQDSGSWPPVSSESASSESDSFCVGPHGRAEGLCVQQLPTTIIPAPMVLRLLGCALGVDSVWLMVSDEVMSAEILELLACGE